MKDNFPTRDVIERLHKKYAPSSEAFDLIFTHSLIIEAIVRQLIANLPNSVNKELVTAGALVHDIGTYSLFLNTKDFDEKNYILHGIRGYELLKNENYPESLRKFCIHHTGVGISKQEIIDNNLPLPPQDYFAQTIEEELVMYADKFHSKVPQFNSYTTALKNIQKYGEEKTQRFHALVTKFGVPELEELAHQYIHQVI